jgi:hypothetical protein
MTNMRGIFVTRFRSILVGSSIILPALIAFGALYVRGRQRSIR